LHVTISRDLKLAGLENLYVFLAEGRKPKLDLPADLNKTLQSTIRTSGFQGRRDETVSVLAGSPKRLTLVGLGDAKKLSHKAIRAAIRSIGVSAGRNRESKVAVVFPYNLPGNDALFSCRLVADLIANADYRYDRFITKKKDDAPRKLSCTLLAPTGLSVSQLKKLTAESNAIAEAVRTVRDLGNGPGNVVTPEALGKRAQEISRKPGIRCQVFDKKHIEKMNMGGLLAVNQGSDKEPRFIVMDWNPRGAKKTVCLVGKGITFDSGGISIKPSERMEEMKFDMCGAAAVIGSLQAAASLKVPHRVVGIVSSTENLPSGSAYKPGDIITTISGKTVEVVNTDAEGRVVLSDALAYSSKFKPDHVIDFATLTGACVIALGYEASGLFSSDDKLASRLISIGETVGERIWRLPEWDDYRDYIKSEWADMKNSGGRAGGSISAALFLKEFVDCPSWAHFDIAGTAWAETESAHNARGATGVGVRAMVRFLETLS
jgi:leucyl aminopeptidase